MLNRLLPALEEDGPNDLVVLTWGDCQDHGSCCGLPQSTGGRIPVGMISPLVRNHFKDPTPLPIEEHFKILGIGLPWLCG